MSPASIPAAVGTFRCSVASVARGDSMIATAAPAQRWLLLEHPGPWLPTARDSLEPSLSRAIAARAAAMHARISLIRRPGRHPRDDGPCRWAVADTRPGLEGIRWSTAHHPAELLAADWDVRPGEGEPVALVCAHSRHDVCCALRGRPAAAALEQSWPGRVWECSHLGGDRFAATMVLLPHGLYYGRVDPAAGPQILEAYEQGLVVPTLLRGRCAYRRHEQAAQALVREAGLAGTDIAALRPLSSHVIGPDLAEVVLDGQPPLRVVLREHTVRLGTPASCRATVEGVGYDYELLAATAVE